jgi:drug/metabolite transporter (DMT)-like permease
VNIRIKAHLSLFFANLIFALNYIVAKDVLKGYIEPLAFTTFRLSGAVIMFWLTGLFCKNEKIEKKDLIRFVFSAFFGVVLNQYTFLAGLKLTSPIDASIIMTLNPVMVLIISAIWLKDKISTMKITGIIVGAMGALILIGGSATLHIGSGSLGGNILIIVNCASWAAYLVLIKPLMEKYHPVTVMKYVFLLGWIMVIPLGISPMLDIAWMQMPVKILMEAFFVVLAATFVGYFFNMYGLKFLRPVTVSIYIYSQPVLAAFIAIMLGRDKLTLMDIISAALVFLGVYLTTLQNKSPIFNIPINNLKERFNRG